MASDRERKQLRNELADLRERTTAGGPAGKEADRPVDIVWREAAPAERPEGMEWVPDSGDSGDGHATLAFDFWDAQARCLNALEEDQDIVAFLGGYRSGKSVTGARWLLSHAIEIPGSRWLALGVSFQQASSTTYRTLFEQLPGERTHLLTSGFTGPEQSPLVTDYNRQEHRLTLYNDTIITLGSADKWSRYAGDEYAGIWMDEPSHYGSELFDIREMMGSRLTADRGPKSMFWSLTGNGYNPAWQILEQREDVNGDPINDQITIERASVLNNPYIDEAAKEQLRRRYGGTSRAEQALFGGFAAAQGLVYSNFSRATHVIPHDRAVDRVEDDYRIFGYDAGWNDPRVLLEVGKTPYDQLIVLDEYYESSTHIEDAIAWLKREDKPQGTVYCEHEPSDIKKFQRAGWSAKKADKSIDAGISEVRKRLGADGNMEVPEEQSNGPTPIRSYRYPKKIRSKSSKRRWGVPSPSPASSTGSSRSPSGSTSAGSSGDGSPSSTDDARVGLLVSDRCESLIRELLSYKEEDVGTSRAVDHAADSLRYLCMGIDGRETRSRSREPRRRTF